MEEKKKTMADTFIYAKPEINKNFVSQVVDITMPDKLGSSTVLFRDGSSCAVHWFDGYLGPNMKLTPRIAFDKNMFPEGADISKISLPLFKIILAYGIALPEKSALDAVDRDITDDEKVAPETLYTVLAACKAVEHYNKTYKYTPPQI